jgi:hypothetical protein
MTLFPFLTFLQKFFPLVSVTIILISFLSTILLLKARARYLDMLSNEFSIHCGVRKGCPLLPIF